MHLKSMIGPRSYIIPKEGQQTAKSLEVSSYEPSLPLDLILSLILLW